MLRVTVEFLWVVRRQGVNIAPSQSVDCVRATKLLGYGNINALRTAYGAILAQSERDRNAVVLVFDQFFLARAAPRSLREALEQRGLSPAELNAICTMLVARASFDDDAGSASTPLGSALAGDASWNHALLLAGLGQTIRKPPAPLQLGFQTQRMLTQAGFARAGSELGELQIALAGEFGAGRAKQIATLLQQELQRRAHELRDLLERARTNEAARTAAVTNPSALALQQLSADDALAVRRSIRALGEKLAKVHAVRRKHARRGKLDARKTLALARRTGFVPHRLAFRRAKPKRPELWLLCDISESVRESARFMLELAAAAHTAFAKTRCFVFVSEPREVTALLAERGTQDAIAAMFGGEVVPLTRNSNYARAFDQLLREHGPDLTRRTSLVILGDGRTNFLGDGIASLTELGKKARSLVWIASEPRSRWGEGDSAMLRYAAICTQTLEGTTLQDLERAIMRLAQR
jgi:uncharacterized protein